MIKLPNSSLSVSYDLRPSKQIERRMMLDVLILLQSSEINIRKYKYIGFGSIYFVDFILFHKLLGIQDLLSIEGETEIISRVHFNKPYTAIKIDENLATDTLNRMEPDIRTILWLDYDYRLDQNLIHDIELASSRLAPGSFLFVTIDARPPIDYDTPIQWMKYFEQIAVSYFDFDWTLNNFTLSELPSTTSKILFNIINKQVKDRPNLQYQQLFNFSYIDSKPMQTVGGIIATENELKYIEKIDFSNLGFVRKTKESGLYNIVVPKLTRKEKLYLDQFMPPKAGWKLKEFELSEDSIQAYSEIYRYYPPYSELAF